MHDTDREVEAAIRESAELAREAIAELRQRLADGPSTREVTQILKALNSNQKNLAALRTAAAAMAKEARQEREQRATPLTIDDITAPKRARK